MKTNDFGGIEYRMEPCKFIELGTYDTWIPMPEEVEPILSQIKRITHSWTVVEFESATMLEVEMQD